MHKLLFARFETVKTLFFVHLFVWAKPQNSYLEYHYCSLFQLKPRTHTPGCGFKAVKRSQFIHGRTCEQGDFYPQDNTFRCLLVLCNKINKLAILNPPIKQTHPTEFRLKPICDKMQRVNHVFIERRKMKGILFGREKREKERERERERESEKSRQKGWALIFFMPRWEAQ